MGRVNRVKVQRRRKISYRFFGQTQTLFTHAKYESKSYPIPTPSRALSFIRAEQTQVCAVTNTRRSCPFEGLVTNF